MWFVSIIPGEIDTEYVGGSISTQDRQHQSISEGPETTREVGCPGAESFLLTDIVCSSRFFWPLDSSAHTGTLRCSCILPCTEMLGLRAYMGPPANT